MSPLGRVPSRLSCAFEGWLEVRRAGQSLGGWLEVLLMIGGAAVLDLGLIPLNLWFLVYDSDSGRLHFSDVMPMTSSHPMPRIEHYLLSWSRHQQSPRAKYRARTG